MLIQSVAIGSEVLKGSTINTNSAFLARELLSIGLKVQRQTVVDDDPINLFKIFQESIDNYDLTIFSGGLGPTVDDLTKDTIAKFFNRHLVFNKKIEEDLKNRYPGSPTISDQSQQIESALLLRNTVGTAYGFILEKDNKRFVFLPGVPKEFEYLVTSELIPWIKNNFSLNAQFNKSFLIFEKKESDIDPLLRIFSKECPKTTFGIYPQYGFVTLSISSSSKLEIEYIQKELINHYSEFLAENMNSPIEALHSLLSEKNITISVAESCTGGKISQLLSSQPGASKYFLGAVISYSNTSKIEILEVDEDTIKKYGAVSYQCAEEMARQVKKKFKSDLSLSVTGLAGPGGGSDLKPVGTIFMHIKFQDENLSYNLELNQKLPRDVITTIASNRALFYIYKILKYSKN